MKKQEGSKKGLKWGLISAGGVLLVLAVVVAALLILKPTPEQAPESKLYWNVERAQYASMRVDGMTARMPRSDGYYWMRFAVDGEQVDIPVADALLVEQVDMLDLMTLVMDENGVVIDAIPAEYYAGGLAVDRLFVESIDGNKVTCNTSGLYKGVSVTVEVPDSANIYNVGGEGLLVGMTGTISLDDQMIAVQDEEGVITDVFVIPYEVPDNVYWNLVRKYDSSMKMTTRETSASGYYEYQMCHGGQIVTVKTQDRAVANAIDAPVACCMGLTFDEQGFAIGVQSARAATGGAPIGSWHHVMEINGNTITMEKFSGSDKGNIDIGTLSPSSKIVLTTTGEYTQLQVGDQVHCLMDARGRLAYVFIVNRLSSDIKVAWNVERKYDSANKVTTRVPDKDGYYRFTMAVDGEQVEMKTKDIEIATKIDSYASKVVSVLLDGDEILNVGGVSYGTGGSAVLSWYQVDSVEDGVITATKRTDQNSSEYMNTDSRVMLDDCKVYNVSPTTNKVGEETTVQVGDTIHCLTDYKGDLMIVYVVTRPVSGKIGYNLERMYDSAKKTTTREKAADGYYYILMAVDGKQRTLKTKDRDIVNTIDAYAGGCMGLQLNGDVIVKAYSTKQMKGYTGGVEVSWCDVISINGRTAIAQRTLSGADQGKKYTMYLSGNCQVYNVSSGYVSFRGEKTTLKVGDRVHCLRDENNNTTLIYVVNRSLEGVVGWNISRQWDADKATTKRTPDEEGWYYIDMAVEGQYRTLKTKDVKMINMIDSNAAMCRGLVLEGDEIKRVVKASEIKGTDGGVNGSWVTVTEVTKTGCKAVQIGGAEDGKIYNIPMADDCQVYNVSNTYKSHRGEKTTVKYGALIHALINTKGQATVIYVITEGIENAHAETCQVCGKTVTWAPWDGTTKMVNGVHYYLEKDIHLNTYVTIGNANVTLFLNGHTITSDSRAFRINAGGVLSIYDGKNGKDIGGKIIGKGLSEEEAQAEQKGVNEGGVIMLWSASSAFNLHSGTLQLAAEHNAILNGGVITGAGAVTVTGGNVIGGTVSANGGAVRLYGEKASLTMTGGTITGGQAKNGSAVCSDNGGAVTVTGGKITGGDIALTKTSPITISGQVEIQQITLTDSVIQIGEAGLKNSQPIGILDRNIATAFAANAQAADQGRFFCVEENYLVEMGENKELFVKSSIPPHTHCVCGGHTAGVGDHTACEDVEWMAWTDANNLPITAGNYYLECDVTVGKITTNIDADIKLCLNGHKITTSGALWIRGNMTVTDCGEEEKWGSIFSTRSGHSAIFYSYERNKLSLYAGILDASQAGTNVSGTVSMATDDTDGDGVAEPSYFYMYGGKIVGRNAGTANGGGVWTMHTSEFYMYGGTITGSAGAKGGAIYAGDSSKLFLYGGTITGNKTTGNGAVYWENNAALTVGGEIQILDNTNAAGDAQRNVYLRSGQTLRLDALKETAKIGITMEVSGDVALNVTTDLSAAVISDNTEDQVRYDQDAQKLYMTQKPHKHCVCGGHAVGVGDHTSCDDMQWTAWTDAGSLPTTTGNYYLTCNVTFSKAITTQVDSKINLCLNGFTVSNSERVWLKGDFTVTDCKETGTIASTFPRHTAIFYTYERCTLRLYAGTLDGSGAGKNYAVVSLCNDDTNGDGKKDPSYFYMYGGTIIGRDAGTESGGAIQVMANAELHMYGGLITGGKATKGGAIFITNNTGVVDIQGGTITGNKSDVGGAIACNVATSTIKVSGSANITGNTNASGTAENNIYLLTGQKLILGELTKNAKVGVTMQTAGDIALTVALDVSQQVTSDNTSYTVTYDPDNKKLYMK